MTCFVVSRMVVIGTFRIREANASWRLQENYVRFCKYRKREREREKREMGGGRGVVKG